MLCLSGFEPQLADCPACGREPADPMFSLRGGSVHCRTCPPGVPGLSLPLDGAALDAMRYVVAAEPKKIFAFRIPETSEQNLGAVCEAYLDAQLERGFRTLDYYKSLKL